MSLRKLESALPRKIYDTLSSFLKLLPHILTRFHTIIINKGYRMSVVTRTKGFSCSWDRSVKLCKVKNVTTNGLIVSSPYHLQPKALIDS